MRTDTLFQLCLYFCLCMLIFNLSVGFIAASDFFQVDENSQPAINYDPTTTKGNDTIKNVTKSRGENVQGERNSYTFNNVWSILFGAGIIGTILIQWGLKDVRFSGVYIFGLAFWGSYFNLLDVVGFGGLAIPAGIIGIITSVSILMFTGAVVGMLTGSG